MTNKIYIVTASAVITGLSIYLILKKRIKADLNSNEEFNDENNILEKANHHLLIARNKAEEMMHEAEEKSNSILEQAGKILSSAKEKTSSIHFERTESAENEVNKIKEEIEESITEFRKKMGL